MGPLQIWIRFWLLLSEQVANIRFLRGSLWQQLAFFLMQVGGNGDGTMRRSTASSVNMQLKTEELSNRQAILKVIITQLN
eukprot:2244086-Amphidinium_carterae.1